MFGTKNLSKEEPMTPISKTLEELIREIYQDGSVSVVEYKTLRDEPGSGWADG